MAHEQDSRTRAMKGEPPKLPPFEKGVSRCPACKATSPEVLRIPSNWVIPFAPRRCTVCSHTWTPKPWKILAILYGLCGLGFLITAGIALVMVPTFIVEWNQDTAPITLFRLGWIAMWCIGGLFSLMIGMSFAGLARQIIAQ